MMPVMAAASLGTVTGVVAVAITFSAMLSGKREDRRASGRQADALRREVQGVAVHAEDNAHAVR